MTGRYSIRSGNQTVALAGSTGGLVTWERTLAELLRDKGYATGIVGKWHVGASEPTDKGFDEWIGIPHSYDEALWCGAEPPKDRIIDGLDQSAFFEGKTDTSAREGFPFWMGDRMYGVKWRNFKVVSVLQGTLSDPALDLATPHIINLDVDPKERKPYDYPYIHTWVIAHAERIVADFKASTQAEELIPVGAPLDFIPRRA